MENLNSSQPLEDAQHETFACIVAEGKTAQGRAYIDAGYECKSMDVAYANASRLLRNDKVQARIRYLKEQAADQTIADKAFILELLVKNALDAREVKQFAASNRAAELLGREWDMFKGNVVLEDKREQPVRDLSTMSPKELKAYREELLNRDN